MHNVQIKAFVCVKGHITTEVADFFLFFIFLTSKQIIYKQHLSKKRTKVYRLYTRAPGQEQKRSNSKSPSPYITPSQSTKSTIDIVSSFKPTLMHSKRQQKKEDFNALSSFCTSLKDLLLSPSKQSRKWITGQPSKLFFFSSPQRTEVADI